jgi:hypothetical protein
MADRRVFRMHTNFRLQWVSLTACLCMYVHTYSVQTRQQLDAIITFSLLLRPYQSRGFDIITNTAPVSTQRFTPQPFQGKRTQLPQSRFLFHCSTWNIKGTLRTGAEMASELGRRPIHITTNDYYAGLKSVGTCIAVGKGSYGVFRGWK